MGFVCSSARAEIASEIDAMHHLTSGSSSLMRWLCSPSRRRANTVYKQARGKPFSWPRLWGILNISQLESLSPGSFLIGLLTFNLMPNACKLSGKENCHGKPMQYDSFVSTVLCPLWWMFGWMHLPFLLLSLYTVYVDFFPPLWQFSTFRGNAGNLVQGRDLCTLKTRRMSVRFITQAPSLKLAVLCINE